MQTTGRVLNVFLASPSDVGDERLAAEEVISDLNKITSRRLGWNIHLDKWEDTPPAFGRPQDLINPAVDTCDLFVGLLWQRWGEATGRYSSGFEEEYERVRSRRRETGAPEIWLIFKDVDPERLKDPGVQLNKVIEFKRAQAALGEVLYKRIGDLNDWNRNLRNWLWDHILSIHESAPQIGQPTSAPQPSSMPGPPSAAVVGAESQAKIPKQVVEIAESLTRVVKSGDLEFSIQNANVLHEFDVARLFLLSSTWMSHRYTGNTVGTHEVNVLFKYRDKLKATGVEAFQLFRALIADTSAVVPGWFWLTHLKLDMIRSSLLSMSSTDRSDHVRWRALQFLLEAEIRLPKTLWPILPFGDESSSVRSAAYEYLGFIGDDDARSRIEKTEFGDDSLVASAAGDAALTISLRLRPFETASALIGASEYVSDKTLSEIEAILPEVDNATLTKGAESQWGSIRKVAITELIRRNTLPSELAKKLTEDPSVEVREMAFQELAKQGQRPEYEKVRKSLSSESGTRSSLGSLLAGEKQVSGDAHAVMRAFFRHQPPDIAEGTLNWFGLEGVSAYKSLALDHFDRVRNELRNDLEDDFARIRKLTNDKIKLSLGEEAVNSILEQFKEVDNFIRSQYLEAALEALAIHGEPSDIRFGKQYLSSDYSSVKLAAVKIVCRFGTADDAAELLRISKDGYGDMRDEAGIGALRLSRTPFETAVELTKIRSDKLTTAAFNWLYAQDLDQVHRFFDDLLNSDSDTNRVRAVYYFSKKLRRNRLIKLLKDQFDRGSYYYNVVTWLDRILYSPRAVRKFFVKELERHALKA